MTRREDAGMSDEKDNERGTCEVIDEWLASGGTLKCGYHAVYRYPAQGGGYMRLCDEHGAKHAKYSERWTPDGWMAPSPVQEP